MGDVAHPESLSASLFIGGESGLYRGALTCLLLIFGFLPLAPLAPRNPDF